MEYIELPTTDEAVRKAGRHSRGQSPNVVETEKVAKHWQTVLDELRKLGSCSYYENQQ